MRVVKRFVDELAKHQLLIYFVTLWGISMFFWSLYYLIDDFTDLMDALWLLYNLAKLGAGGALTIFGIKLMRPDFITALDKYKMVIYFLLMWAVSFFFIGIYDMADHAPYMFEYWDCFLAFLGALAEFFAGIVLGLFSWNLLKQPEQTTET